MSCSRCGRAILGTAIVCFCALSPGILREAAAIPPHQPDVQAHWLLRPLPERDVFVNGSNTRFARPFRGDSWG